MSNSKSCKCNLLVFMLVALLTYIVYDCKLNGSFERSNSAKYLKRWNIYNYVHPFATSTERTLLLLKKQYDANYGATVNFYVDELVKKYDTNVRPTVDPYIATVYNFSSPYVESLKVQSFQTYRVAEKYYATYARKAGLFLEKNVFTGPLEINNLKLVVSDTYEKVASLYLDAYKWAASKISSLAK